MKTTSYILSLSLIFALSLSSCTQKKEKKENFSTEVNEQSEENSLPMVTETEEPQQDEETTSPTDIINTPQVLSENDFINRITDINNSKGFQYKGTLPCIVDFYADWCRPCHALNPILVSVAEKYQGKIIIYKLNVDKAASVSGAFGVRSIPSLVFFKPNNQPVKVEGAPSQEQLEKAINELLLN